MSGEYLLKSQFIFILLESIQSLQTFSRVIADLDAVDTDVSFGKVGAYSFLFVLVLDR